jgi:hypothetical protein
LFLPAIILAFLLMDALGLFIENNWIAHWK